jgi:hypothetical protein
MKKDVYNSLDLQGNGSYVPEYHVAFPHVVEKLGWTVEKEIMKE